MYITGGTRRRRLAGSRLIHKMPSHGSGMTRRKPQPGLFFVSRRRRDMQVNRTWGSYLPSLFPLDTDFVGEDVRHEVVLPFVCLSR